MIVQCHGHFDLLHPGHLRHLKQASELGKLTVTLTSGRWMTKPGHPIFTDDERLEMIRELRCVDSALVIDDPTPYKAIELVKPDIYVKGLEYQGRLPEQAFCEARGIEVRFLGEKIYGSTRINDQIRLLRST